MRNAMSNHTCSNIMYAVNPTYVADATQTPLEMSLTLY